MQTIEIKTYPYPVMMDPRAQAARRTAMTGHDAIQHRRKYTNEPYWVHLEEVAMIVAKAGGSVDQVCAAWLHDFVEDKAGTMEQVIALFGAVVAALVADLTDVSKPSDGNRAARKAIDRKHTAKASKEAKMIKLADVISNTKSIVAHDRVFAKVYLEEKAQLLPYIKEGHGELYKEAYRLITEGKRVVFQ